MKNFFEFFILGILVNSLKRVFKNKFIKNSNANSKYKKNYKIEALIQNFFYLQLLEYFLQPI